MISKERLVNEFLELVEIDSLTKKEREMIDALSSKVKNLGIFCYEDNAGELVGGEAGNLICHMPSNLGESLDNPSFGHHGKSKKLLFAAHVDTVEPGTGKKGMIDGEYIRSGTDAVLGADDLAGAACMLEAMEVIKEENIWHDDIWFIFTIGEEGGMYGAKGLDISRIDADFGIVLDGGGEIGTVTTSAPSHYTLDITFTGKAAHAGVCPEEGINAAVVAAKAISGMRIGRIDHETTANIGMINGGSAINIVCEKVNLKAEIRSIDSQKLENEYAYMRKCIYDAAAEYGAEVSIDADPEYKSFKINDDDELLEFLRKSAESVGIVVVTESSGGGSDTNILNEKGIKSVNISVGMNQCHTREENVKIADLVKTAGFVVSIVKNSII